MLTVIGGAPGEVVGGRGMPAVLCQVVQPAEILGVVVPVVGENVEALAPVHLHRVLSVAPGKDARELHQRVVIHGGGAPVCFQDSGGRQHMAADGLTGSLFPVKTPHGKISATTPGRQQPGFGNHNAAGGGAIHIFFFHAPHFRHFPGSRELDNPLLRHYFGPGAAGTTAKLKKCIQVADILLKQQRLALSGEHVQIPQMGRFVQIPRRAIGQRAHTGASHNSQPFQRCDLFRRKAAMLQHAVHQQAAPCVG